MVITVKDGQSLADIALQYLGDVSGIIALAERNQISITAQLADGQKLEYEVQDIINDKIAKKYAAQHISPATDVSDNDMRALLSATIQVINIQK